MKYRLNKHGVVTNPKTERIETKRENAEINWALIEKKWYNAIKINCGSWGQGGPVCKDRNAFADEDDCKMNAWQQIASLLENGKDSKANKLLKLVLGKLSKYQQVEPDGQMLLKLS